MCGIVAVTGYKKALPLLINGLEKLEYRGYDSAGIAIINSETKNIFCNKFGIRPLLLCDYLIKKMRTPPKGGFKVN